MKYIKIIIHITILFLIVGCSNMLSELSRVEMTDGQEIVLPLSDGTTISGNIVLTKDQEGIDLDNDGIADISIILSESTPADGLYFLDMSNDGTGDSYIKVNNSGTSSIKTTIDDSDVESYIVINDEGEVLGLDTDGDGELI